MDPISYSKASQQEQRIKKFVAQPDSIAGLVTVPNLVPTGETVSIPTGRTLVHPSLQVAGILDVQGTLFIPSGGSVSTTEVDATVVKQNGNVVANDSEVVHKTGNETKTGTMTFMDNVGIVGNVGIGVNPDNYYSLTLGGSIYQYGSQYNVHTDVDCEFVQRGAGGYKFYVNSGTKQPLTITAEGNVLVTGSGGLGYGTGSGGTVTQLTSKSTAVTLNKPSGQITMNNAALAAGASVTFGVYNSLMHISAIDNVVVTPVYNTVVAPNYKTEVFAANLGGTGGFIIKVTNVSGSTLSEPLAINFNIFKGATA